MSETRFLDGGQGRYEVNDILMTDEGHIGRVITFSGNDTFLYKLLDEWGITFWAHEDDLMKVG